MEDEDTAPNTYLGTADPVGMGRKSCQYTIFQYSVRLAAHTNWISYMYFSQYPSLPFCVHIYLKSMYVGTGILKT